MESLPLAEVRCIVADTWHCAAGPQGVAAEPYKHLWRPYEEHLGGGRSACCRDFVTGVCAKEGTRSSGKCWKGNARNCEHSRRHSAGCTRQDGLCCRFAFRGQIRDRKWPELRQGGDDLPRRQGFQRYLGCSNHDGARGWQRWLAVGRAGNRLPTTT